jgi:hypothetical protein
MFALVIHTLSTFNINTKKRRQHVIYLRHTVTTSQARTFLAKRVNSTIKWTLADFWTAIQQLLVLTISLQLLIQKYQTRTF